MNERNLLKLVLATGLLVVLLSGCPQKPVCGDGVCGENENKDNCAMDCGEERPMDAYDLAVKNKDPVLCEKVETVNGLAGRNGCYFVIARNNLLGEVCDKITADETEPSIAYCKWSTARQWRLKANELDEAGQTEEALAGYEEALKLDPTNAVIHYDYGLALSHAERFEEAIASYTKAIELEANENEPFNKASAYYNRAILYAESGQLETALPDALKAIELEPEDPWKWFTKGRILQDLGQKDESIQAFEKALELDSEFQPAKEALEESKAIKG